MQFDFTQISAANRYKLLGSTIVPRPIAWVSTLGPDGRLNAAPFSFFNAFSEDPPIVGFSVLHRSAEDLKDTGANIRARGEFVVNLVDDATLDPMVVSAIEFAPHVSEFAEAGLTPAPSIRIEAPRILESRVSMECRLHQIMPIGERRSLIMGEVLMMHVADEAVIDADRAWIDTGKLELIGRMGANRYVRTADVIERPVPSADSWKR